MGKEIIQIELPVTTNTFIDLVKTDPVTAAKQLEPEINAFERWMELRGMDPLTRYERQILREYLGRKLTSSKT